MKTEEAILEQWTSADGKTLILEKFFNKKLDLYRDYSETDLQTDYSHLSKAGQENERMYVRTGLDPRKAIQFTDMVMFGWQMSVGNQDFKAVGLNKIVHKWINTQNTVETIQAELDADQKKGDQLNNGQVAEWKKGEPGFDKIAATVHVRRVAQLMNE